MDEQSVNLGQGSSELFSQTKQEKFVCDLKHERQWTKPCASASRESRYQILETGKFSFACLGKCREQTRVGLLYGSEATTGVKKSGGAERKSIRYSEKYRKSYRVTFK
jgi:hypothetical protein